MKTLKFKCEQCAYPCIIEVGVDENAVSQENNYSCLSGFYTPRWEAIEEIPELPELPELETINMPSLRAQVAMTVLAEMIPANTWINEKKVVESFKYADLFISIGGFEDAD